VKKGLVSVIVPTYNRPESLRRTLESIFRQSYRNLEVIVVDDGSEVDISRSVEGFPVRKVIRQKHAGANIARNRGFALSRGEYLFICDDDLELEPHLLRKLVRALKAKPRKAYAYCGFRVDGKVRGMGRFDPERLRRKNYISGVSLIRRSKFPGFDPGIRRLQDWDLWLTMLERGEEGVQVPEVLFETTLRNSPSISDDSNPSGWTYAHAYRVVARKHKLSHVPKPLEALVRVYDSRQDLQEAYPEVKCGDYTQLIAWAYHVITRGVSDEAFGDLLEYKKTYKEMHMKSLSSKGSTAATIHRLQRQLKKRNTRIFKLQKEFEERTQWTLKLQEEIKQRDARIQDLDNTASEWKGWIESLKREMESRDSHIRRMRTTIDEWKNWIPRLQDEIRELRTRASNLQTELEQVNREFEERTEWALRLDKEVKEKDQRIVELEKEIRHLAEWGQNLDKVVAEKDQTIKQLQKELEERTEWAKRLDAEIQSLRSQARATGN